MVFDGAGKKIGNVENPYKCCEMDQRIFGIDGTQIYGAVGSSCQKGVCCPCLAPVEFQLTDTNGEPTDGGIQKIFGGCAEVRLLAASLCFLLSALCSWLVARCSLAACSLLAALLLATCQSHRDSIDLALASQLAATQMIAKINKFRVT